MAWKRIIKPTKQELAYRDKHFHDIRIIKDEQIACTSCGNELNIKTNQIFSHPFIGILQCEICWNHLKVIQVKFDEKKARKYCHICGKNEKLYVCCDKDCFAAFCKRCIKRNVSSSLLDTEKEDWKCFMCNPKPIWDLRAVCAVVMDSLPKKGNKRSTKSDKRILPSQVQQIEKTRDMQKHLRTLCDREDDDSSEESFVSARSAQRINSKSRHTNHDTSSKQKTISEVDLVDSSSNDLFPKNANLSHKKDKQSKSERDQRAKSIRDSNRSTQQVSKSIVREKNTSRRYKISSDSSDSTDSSAKTNPEMYKRNVKSEKIVKRKPNSSRVYSSGSESDENDTKRASSKSKKISKDTKMDHSYNAKSKDKVMKDYDSTSESEDEHKKERREKRSETNQMTSHSNNDERKRNKSLMKSNIEDDSDNSSSKEFQKMKFQKVNRNKYSKRQLVNLEIDYTKTPMKNSNDKSKKHMSEQSNENLDLKQILRDCKKIFSDFQMYTETTIETIEQLYNKKEDEERLIMEFTEKLVKVRTMLKEKQKKVTIYQAWKNRKKSATKRHKVVSDDEQSSEECEKGTVDEAKRISGDEQDGNKAVSECDSEEIFSGNETKTPQKTRETQPKANTSKTKNSLNNSGISSTDDEDGMDESKNNDKNNEVNMCDALATSPVLDSKEKKTSTERLNKKELFSENAKTKQAQLTDENTNTNDDKQANINTNTNNETEIEESASKDSNKKKILENRSIDEIDQSNCINESVDMFDTSFEDVFATEVKIEKNCDKGKLSKDEFSDSCKSSLRDKIPSGKEKTPLLSSDIGEEKDLLNQNDQEVSTPNEEVHNSSKTSGKTNTDDYESLDDAEALAKKALLATDSDTSDTSENVAKLTEDLITNNTNRTEKMNEIKDDDSDVSSVSTIMLSTFIKKTNTDVKKDTSIEAETEVIKESDNRLNQDTSSIDEEAKAEKAAKKALLESNSDDSTFLSSESEKLIQDKKSESDFSQKNTKAKLALLASSSDNSSSEPVQSETNVSKNTKRNHEPESDGESVISKLKKRRLKHNENYHYKNDKKLRMSCEVHLARLNADVLKCYSRALRKSREYLARKAFKRYPEFSVKPISIVLQRLT